MRAATAPSSAAAAPAPRGGPRTPEGNARSALNSLRHGLRAARFALLPHEDAEAFRDLVEALRRAHAPEDPVELLYVDAIAVAIWRELRADRLEAEALADIAPAEPDRSCGSDLAEPTARASLATLARYRAAAQAEHRRALKLLEEHRRLRLEALDRAARGGRPDALADLPTVETEAPEPQRVGLRERAREQLATRARICASLASLAALGADPLAGPPGADPLAGPPGAAALEPSAGEPTPTPPVGEPSDCDPFEQARALLDRWLEEHPDGIAEPALRRRTA